MRGRARGDAAELRCTSWQGQRPKPGDGVRTSTKRYLVTAVELPRRAGRTIFIIRAVVLGVGDPDPLPMHRWVWD